MRTALFATVAVLAACAGAPPPNPSPRVNPGERGDAGSSGEATPAAVCASFRRAGCAEGFPTPGGRSCEDVFAASSGRRWPLECYVAASDRAAIIACGGTRCVVAPPDLAR